MAKKVLVAMSGGVDSSVAAYLLQSEGYDLAGITMEIWQEGNTNAVEDAKKVAEALNIKHYVLDVRNEFRKLVIEPFISEYLCGRTPNPCVLCNEGIKWGLLFEKAIEIGADYFATGHYAEIIKTGERLSLKQTGTKDQTYALYRLSQKALENTLFPLGKYSKEEVRRIAKEAGLDVYNKRDSQEICFISDNDHAAFITRYTGKNEEKGEFVLADGTVLGVHSGISNYTIGQRKGLGVSYSEPLFVWKLDMLSNRVVLGRDSGLYSSNFMVTNMNYLSVSGINNDTSCIAKVRYAHRGAKCVITPVTGSSDILSCRFTEPQRAITPGQSAVFYDDNGVIIVGGVIDTVEMG